MKRIVTLILILILLITIIPPVSAADSNIDGGGSDLGEGTKENIWNPGREGIRVTIVRDSDNTPVSKSIDFSNNVNNDIQIHFQHQSKLDYRNGSVLTPKQGGYTSIKPSNAMPRIITSKNSTNNIEAIRNYFCREGTIKDIAIATDFEYDALISGEYKILLEPMAYFKFQGVMYGMTATEAAYYNKQVANKLRGRMRSLTHKNLPLSMFLETPDLGYPAWQGSTTESVYDDTIISSLGLGIIRFSAPDPEPPKESNVTYRCDTEVITSVTLSTDFQKTPDNPAYAYFIINGKTYTHTDIYIPEGNSQLAWVKWRTPKEPGIITISVVSNCNLSNNEIVAEIIDLDKNPPPDPQANDRNDTFRIPTIPNKPNVLTMTWGEWDCWWYEYWVWHSTGNGGGYWCDHGWWEYEWIPYSASLVASLETKPDEKSPTAEGKRMKSGYGINADVSAQVRSSAPSNHITGIQNVVAYFPEFNYATFWRLLERLDTGLFSTFEFQQNIFSTYGQSCHFTPVWYPDGRYTTYVECLDAWTPAGMMQINLTNDLIIRGSLYDDWHIGPKK